MAKTPTFFFMSQCIYLKLRTKETVFSCFRLPLEQDSRTWPPPVPREGLVVCQALLLFSCIERL